MLIDLYNQIRGISERKPYIIQNVAHDSGVSVAVQVISS